MKKNVYYSPERIKTLNALPYGLMWGVLFLEICQVNYRLIPPLHYAMVTILFSLGVVLGRVFFSTGSVNQFLAALLPVLGVLYYGFNGYSCAFAAGLWFYKFGPDFINHRLPWLLGFISGAVLAELFKPALPMYQTLVLTFIMLQITDNIYKQGAKWKRFCLCCASAFLLLISPGMHHNFSAANDLTEAAPVYCALGSVNSSAPSVYIPGDSGKKSLSALCLSLASGVTDITVTKPEPGQKFDLIIIDPTAGSNHFTALRSLKYLKDDGIFVMPAKYCSFLPNLQWKYLPDSNQHNLMAMASKESVVTFNAEKINRNLIKFFPKMLLDGGTAGVLTGFEDRPVPLPPAYKTSNFDPGSTVLLCGFILVLAILEFIGARRVRFNAQLKIFENALVFAAVLTVTSNICFETVPKSELLFPGIFVICTVSGFMLRMRANMVLFLLSSLALALYILFPDTASGIAAAVLIGISFSAEKSLAGDKPDIFAVLSTLAGTAIGIMASILPILLPDSVAPWQILAVALALKVWHKLH